MSHANQIIMITKEANVADLGTKTDSPINQAIVKKCCQVVF